MIMIDSHPFNASGILYKYLVEIGWGGGGYLLTILCSRIVQNSVLNSIMEFNSLQNNMINFLILQYLLSMLSL